MQSLLIKLSTGLSRLIVGVVFIFSGLIKANDPIGFSYKLEEYFEKFAQIFNGWGWSWMASIMDAFAYIALPLAMILVISEVVLGVLSITGSYIKKVSWALLIMILFFTFLTFVSWYFGLVKSCGCFGDAIPLSPFQSFLKDLVLLFFILIMFFFKNKIQPIVKGKFNFIALTSATILSTLFTWYCYQHLPIKDYRAYAPGKAILPQMEPIPGNPLNAFKLTHKKNGATVTFADYPSDYENWEYLGSEILEGTFTVYDVKDTALNLTYRTIGFPLQFENDWVVLDKQKAFFKPDKDPKIQQLSAIDFNDFESDYMDEILNEEGYKFWLTVRSLDHLGTFDQTSMGLKFNPNKKGNLVLSKIAELSDKASKKNLKFYGLSSETSHEKIKSFKQVMNLAFPFYSCDDTELKTIIRSSPGLLLLKKDTVITKWHQNDFPKFEKVENKYLK